MAVAPYFALGRQVETGEQRQQSRFARTGCARYRNGFAAGYCEADIRKNCQSTLRADNLFAYFLGNEYRVVIGLAGHAINYRPFVISVGCYGKCCNGTDCADCW